jgi:hypothetical protein
MLASLIFNQKMRKRIAAIAIVNRVEIDILPYYLEYLGRKKTKNEPKSPGVCSKWRKTGHPKSSKWLFFLFFS